MTDIASRRTLLYDSVFLESIPRLLRFTEALAKRPDLARLCKNLSFCPPIATDYPKHPVIQYHRVISDETVLEWTSAFCPPTAAVLPTSALTNLFKLLSRLQTLQLGGVAWKPIQAALRSAGFKRSLNKLQMYLVAIPDSALPLLSNSAITAFDLKGLDIQELCGETIRYRDKSYVNAIGDAAKRNRINSNVPDRHDTLNATGLQSLESLAMTVRFWEPLPMTKDLDWLESKSRNLTSLRLTIPDFYLEFLIERLSDTVPELTLLDLKIIGEPEQRRVIIKLTLIAATVRKTLDGLEDLYTLLHMTTSLKTFNLKHWHITTALWDALPSTLQHVKIENTQIQPRRTNHSLPLSLRAIIDKISSGSCPSELVTLTYIPDAQGMWDVTNDIRQRGGYDAAVIAVLREYSSDLEELEEVCGKRKIRVDCMFRWDLEKLIEEMTFEF